MRDLTSLTLFLVRGLPGSGKTTAARDMVLDTRGDILVFEADDFHTRPIIRTYNYHQEHARDAHLWCQMQAAKTLRDGTHCIVANTFTTQAEVDPYIEIAERYGAMIELITCTGDYGSTHNVPADVIEKMRERWVPTEHLFLCSRPPAAEQIKEETWLDRDVRERDELGDRQHRLGIFIESGPFYILPAVERDALFLQDQIMESYYMVLTQRVAREQERFKKLQQRCEEAVNRFTPCGDPRHFVKKQVPLKEVLLQELSGKKARQEFIDERMQGKFPLEPFDPRTASPERLFRHLDQLIDGCLRDNCKPDHFVLGSNIIQKMGSVLPFSGCDNVLSTYKGIPVHKNKDYSWSLWLVTKP